VELSAETMERGTAVFLSHRKAYGALQLLPARSYECMSITFSLLMGNSSDFETCKTAVDRSNVTRSVGKIDVGGEFLFGAAIGEEEELIKFSLQIFEDRI